MHYTHVQDGQCTMCHSVQLETYESKSENEKRTNLNELSIVKYPMTLPRLQLPLPTMPVVRLIFLENEIENNYIVSQYSGLY